MPIKFFLPLPGPFVYTTRDKPKPQGPPPVPLHQQGTTGQILSAIGVLLAILAFFGLCISIAVYAIIT